MRLFFYSFTFGLIGLLVGIFMKSDFYACLFGVIGFFSPSIFVLDAIYNELKGGNLHGYQERSKGDNFK